MLKLGRLIGQGKTAEVFEIGDNKVLKLYHPHIGKGLNEYEYSVGCLVKKAGAPSPAVYGHVCVNGRDGIILERAGDISMFDEIARRPLRLRHYARQMARLHVAMHKCGCGPLISQQDFLKSKISFSEGLLNDKTGPLYDYVDNLPGGTSICHGDFHPQNIFNGANGYMIIDWIDISCGHPAGDVARTCIILSSPHIPRGSRLSRLAILLIKKIMAAVYVREYTRLSGLSRSEINRWIVPVAAGRLKDEIAGERKWLLSIVDGRRSLKF